MSKSKTSYSSRTSHIKQEELLQNLKDTQKHNFDEIKKKLNNLPNDIPELQRLLKLLLNNIFIDEYNLDRQSDTTFNIANTTKQNANIYTIPETQDNLDKNKYITFLKFMIQKLYKNNTEFLQNKGKIITAYCNDKDNDKDNDAIQNIKKRYEEIYLSKYISPDKKYPYWVEDLLAKSRNILDKESDNILEQNDTQFLDTLKKRVEGLNKCKSIKFDTNASSKLKQEYYDYEYNTEKEFITPNTNHNNDDKLVKIKNICKNIIWGSKSYDYHIKHKKQNIDTEFENFNNFIKSNPLEFDYLKTFLPSICFNKDELNKDEILKLLNNDDRKYRQYIFGFGDKLSKEFTKYKQFYEIFNIEPSAGNPCHYLVNWNIILNMMYDRCAISNNDIDFPARFILPSHQRHIINNPTNDYNDYNIHLIPPTLDIFDISKNLIFKGFLNIKFFYKQNTNKSGQFRNWILFIFYDINDKEKYIIFNYKFIRVNLGDLIGRISITYRELKDFVNKSKNNKLNFYISNKDKKIVFMSPKIISQKKLLVYDLTSVNINIIYESIVLQFDVNPIFINPIFRITNKEVVHAGGYNLININNINIKFSNNIDLFNDKLSNGCFKEFLNYSLSDNMFNISTINKFEIIKTIYNYLLISANDIIYGSTTSRNIYDKYIITKYKPFNYKYYSIYEIFVKFNILNNIKKNDNILNIGNNFTPIEIILYNNYKINNIKCIILSIEEIYLKTQNKNIENLINKFSNIYNNLDIIYYNNKIENLLNLNNDNKYNLIFYSIFIKIVLLDYIVIFIIQLIFM